MDLALKHKRRETALRIIGGIRMYWIVRGHREPANRWCVEALALPGRTSDRIELEGVIGAGELARVRGEWARAAELKEAALELSARVDDDRRRGALLADLSHIWIRLGDLEVAERLAFEAIEERERHARTGLGRAHALLALAHVRENQGRLEEAIAILEESIALWSVDALDGEVAFVRGRMLGRVLRALGRNDEAYGVYRLAVRDALPTRDIGTVTTATQGLAWLALQRGDHAGGVRLLASVSGSAWQAPLEDHELASFERDVAYARELVPPAAFEAAWAIGFASPPVEHSLSVS
jgi:tetratricopeptide (TPR) repeat protein